MSVFDKVREKLFNKVDGVEPDDSEMTDAADQPAEDQELAAFVKNRVEEARTQATRVSHEGIWMTNIAYLLGYDSVFYDPNSRQFKPSGTSATSGAAGSYLKRNRIHSNLILPAAQNRLARMVKSLPRYEVAPNALTEEDKEAARLGEQVIGNVWDRQQVNRKRLELGMWLQQCGHAYIGVSWDDQLGDPLVDPETEEIAGFEGQTRIDVVSAFEGFPDPLAKSFDELGWFGRAKVRKLDYFRTHYTNRGRLVKEEGVWLLSAQYEQRINTLNNAGSSSSQASEQMKGAAIEVSYYEKRSQKHPRGRHIICANGVLLKNDDLPVGEIPYAKFDDVVIGGKYYSEAVITHVRPLQDQYNRTLVKRAEWTNRMLAGKYIAARGHGLIQEAMNDQSGEIVEYDVVPGAEEPKAMQIPVLPAYAYEETREIEAKVGDAFGLSQVSQGKLPSSSIPGIGIQLLLEQDETRMGVETEQHEHAWARVGMLILKYEDKYAITPRKLKKKAANGAYQIKEYVGADLKKNFDVTVKRGSTVANSRIVSRQDIMNLYMQGLLGNQQDPAVKEKVLGMYETGELGAAWETLHLTKMQIERDIVNIEQGIAPTADEKDNHVVHMIDKNDYRISEKFLDLSPISQQLLQADIATHSQMLMKQMNPQLATPPNPGPPPPPPHVTAVLNAAKRGAPGAPPEPGMPAGPTPPPGAPPGPPQHAMAPPPPPGMHG